MNEPIRGEVTRNYYSSDYFTLPPDEPRRTADPFVEKGNPCPRCERTGRITWSFNVATRCNIAECKCGYYKEQFVGVQMPMTPELQCSEGINLIRYEIVCVKCGKTFKTRADNPKTACQRCRSGQQTAQWQQTHKEQYQETQRRHRAKQKRKEEMKRMGG